MVVNRIVPHLPWFVLLALSVFLYKARIFGESGYYVSQVINTKNFWFESQRIVAAIPQVIPLLSVWIGLEIRYVLLLFSISHVIFFYFLFIFVYYGLRDRRSGLLIILSQTVGIAYSFTTPMFELYYGVPFLITFYAIWRLPFRLRAINILLVLEILILLSHPVAILLFVFLLLYDYTKKGAKPAKYYIPVLLVLAGILVLKYFLLSSYETERLSQVINSAGDRQNGLMHNTEKLVPLGLYILRSYSEVLLALIIITIMLIRRKHWYKLVVVTGTVAALIFIAGSQTTDLPPVYLEHLMFAFVPVAFIPLIYGFPTGGRQGLLNISILLISALIAYRLAIIYFNSEVYTKRVAQIEQLIEAARQKGGNKFVVSKAAIDHGYTQLNWSYPVETLLLSAIDGNDISVTIAPEEALSFNNNNLKIRAGQFILRPWEIKEQSWLNKRYFHLDIGPYRFINDTTPNENIYLTANNLRITIDSKNIYNALDTVWIPVTIVNRGNTPVYSGSKNKVYLSYFWVEKNDVLNWNEIRTPLQADIKATLTQHIRVAIPPQKGRMQLKVDIVADDNWLGISSQEDVLVY